MASACTRAKLRICFRSRIHARGLRRRHSAHADSKLAAVWCRTHTPHIAGVDVARAIMARLSGGTNIASERWLGRVESATCEWLISAHKIWKMFTTSRFMAYKELQKSVCHCHCQNRHLFWCFYCISFYLFVSCAFTYISYESTVISIVLEAIVWS